MVITRGLLFKGLGLCSLCAGGTVLYFKGGDLKGLVSSDSKKKVWGGLECQEPTQQGGNCVLKTGEKIFVKKKSGNPFELSNLGTGKIKVYKVGDNSYGEGFKFLIEDNDITATGTNKLEEFESYEIKLGEDSDVETLKGQHYLSQKTDSREGIKKALGLSCDLPTNSSPQNCDISENKVGPVAISGGTVTLTISKESSKDEYPLGYKFTFKNTNDDDSTLTIGSTSITLKKNSPVDFKIKKEGSSLSLEKAWTLEELAKKVGLAKEGDYWFVGSSGMNIKEGSTKKTGMPKYGNPDGRIKVYSNQAEYKEGLKFTIEKGDLNLTDNNSGNTSSYPLGQFQSFEIVKEENTWYLFKKEGDESKIKNDLGLPCDLPTDSETKKECTLTTENIKAIKFDGKGDEDITFTGTPKLTISKESGRLDYPLGYKFVFSTESNATITISSNSSISLKSNLSYEYKIKRSGDNNQTISLERAWTPESLMVGAAGFANSSNNEWTEAGDLGISIKQDNNKDSGAKTTGAKNAKIRVYEGVPGYNQGFKFIVEEGDTDLKEAGDNINKLSKYETYEVSKDENDKQWYFNRKKKSDESIRELLGLPDSCSMPTQQNTSQTCDLNVSALNGVKFDGKGDTGTTSITESGNSIKLKISKETDTSFPLGYKFTFTSEQAGFTIPKNGSENITIKKNTNTEFKIKVGDRSNLTLEKAWTAESLGEKVKLSCSGNSCSFGNNINVYENDSSYVNEASITNSTNKTLTYELDQEGHNQGIKFYVNGGEDINLSGGNGPNGSGTTISTISKKNGSGTTYEIAQKTVGGGTKWYLVKK